MMNEAAILQARGCPEVMLAAQDVPWEFIGELYTPDQQPRVTSELNLCVPAIPRRCMRRYCACSIKTAGYYSPASPIEHTPVQSVDLLPYEFIDPDTLTTVVFWGQCSACGRVQWARYNPPPERSASPTYA